MYVLVLFAEGPSLDRLEEYAAAHSEFVDSLVRRNLVLLGGDFAEPVGPHHAAYLLRCESVEAAAEIAAGDPFFAKRVLEPAFVEWRLVGVNPDAIDPEAVYRPDSSDSRRS